MPFFARRARYRLQHRYQDSGWENSDDPAVYYTADQLGDVVREAEMRSRHAILWGMCRVVELSSRMVIVEFPAGHLPYQVTVANGRVLLIEGDSVAARDLSPRETYVPDSLSSSSFGWQYADIDRVTAPGPDLPPIDNRAPRGIRLRNKESEAD